MSARQGPPCQASIPTDNTIDSRDHAGALFESQAPGGGSKPRDHKQQTPSHQVDIRKHIRTLRSHCRGRTPRPPPPKKKNSNCLAFQSKPPIRPPSQTHTTTTNPFQQLLRWMAGPGLLCFLPRALARTVTRLSRSPLAVHHHAQLVSI